MSSLFFVMLVLFVLSIVLVFAKTKEIRELIDTLTKQNKELVEQQEIINKQKKELEDLLRATEEELNKIKQLNESIEKIDDRFFVSTLR